MKNKHIRKIKNVETQKLASLRVKLLILLILFAFSLTVLAYAQDLYCQGCGQKIQGKYWKLKTTLTGEEKIFCDNCYKTLPRCFICKLPAGSGRYITAEGNSICRFCIDGGIQNAEKIRTMYYYGLNALSSVLSMKIKTVPALVATSRKELEQLSGNTPGIDQFGLYKSSKTTYTQGGKKWQEIQDAKIYILNYIPYDLAMWTCVHELTHEYCAENSTRRLSFEENEGIAEWAAYKILKYNNFGAFADQMANKNDPYGTALKMMLDKERMYGQDGMLRDLGLKK